MKKLIFIVLIILSLVNSSYCQNFSITVSDEGFLNVYFDDQYDLFPSLAGSIGLRQTYLNNFSNLTSVYLIFGGSSDGPVESMLYQRQFVCVRDDILFSKSFSESFFQYGISSIIGFNNQNSRNFLVYTDIGPIIGYQFMNKKIGGGINLSIFPLKLFFDDTWDYLDNWKANHHKKLPINIGVYIEFYL